MDVEELYVRSSAWAMTGRVLRKDRACGEEEASAAEAAVSVMQDTGKHYACGSGLREKEKNHQAWSGACGEESKTLWLEMSRALSVKD